MTLLIIGDPIGVHASVFDDRIEFADGAIADAQIRRHATAEMGTLDCGFRFQRADSNVPAFTSYRTGNADISFVMYIDGTHAWCDPVVGYDILLARSATGVLRLSTTYGGPPAGTLELGTLKPKRIAWGSAALTQTDNNFNYEGGGGIVNTRTDTGDPTYIAQHTIATTPTVTGAIYNILTGANGGYWRFDAKADGGAVAEGARLTSASMRLASGVSLRQAPVSEAALPPAAGNAGARMVVADSNATLTSGIGAVVAGGGANVVPVFCDGTKWRIG